MLFEVKRTSEWYGKESPYEKCIPIKLTQVETRNHITTPEKFDRIFAEKRENG